MDDSQVFGRHDLLTFNSLETEETKDDMQERSHIEEALAFLQRTTALEVTAEQVDA